MTQGSSSERLRRALEGLAAAAEPVPFESFVATLLPVVDTLEDADVALPVFDEVKLELRDPAEGLPAGESEADRVALAAVRAALLEVTMTQEDLPELVAQQLELPGAEGEAARDQIRTQHIPADVLDLAIAAASHLVCEALPQGLRTQLGEAESAALERFAAAHPPAPIAPICDALVHAIAAREQAEQIVVSTNGLGALFVAVALSARQGRPVSELWPKVQKALQQAVRHFEPERDGSFLDFALPRVEAATREA